MGYTDEQLLPLCTLAAIHDIGAYKVEERTRMIEFEVDHPHEHAVYGSLFVRHFGPFPDSANAILYHHWKYRDRYKIVDDRLIPAEAFLIHLADRVSVLYAHFGGGLADAIRRQMPSLANKTFNPDHVTKLMEMVEQSDIIDRILDGSYLKEFYDYLDQASVTTDEAISYLSALVYIIEFRSHQTVTHSVSVACAAAHIAELVDMPEADKTELGQAALLHDVGKISTPLDILTKPGRLTDTEMDTMRRHVVSTGEILSDTGLDRIRNIASSHHEKLNGKGYPLGLVEQQLCQESRVLAVADILAALVEPRYYKPAMAKEDVLGILGRAAEANDIDASIFRLVENNYDRITAEIERLQKDMLSLYDSISTDYIRVLQEINDTLGGSVRAETELPKAA